MNKENADLKKRIADLEEKVQNQQKEFGQALAFLFDRSEYKELIKQGKVEWPKMLTEALNNLRTAQEVPVQEQLIEKENALNFLAISFSELNQDKSNELLILLITISSLVSKSIKIIKK